MSTPILMVTGARALADLDDSAAWARARIAEALRAHPGSYVLTGDARGPDTWAVEASVARHVILDRHGRTRAQIVRDGHEGWWIEPPHPPAVPGGLHEWRDRLLARDRALVALARRYADHGYTIHVLALMASWSKTHGTRYTAQRARVTGLDVTALTYPKDAP
jgi:hypothetical protein